MEDGQEQRHGMIHRIIKDRRRRVLLTNLVCFAVMFLLTVLLLPASYLLRGTGDDQKNLTGFYAEPPDSLDMVCIGGSSTFVYWEPLRAWNRYGFVSYNFAHNSMTPQESKFDIIEIQKTQSPALWLIDLIGFENADRPYSGDPNGRIKMYAEVPIRNGVDHMRYSRNRIDLINASVLDPEERWSYYVDFIKYHSEWLGRTFTVLREGPEALLEWLDYADCRRVNPYKGFAFIEEPTAAVEFSDYSGVRESSPLPEEVHSVLTDLLEYCRERNLRVLFTISPYCQTQEAKERYNYMEQIVRQYGFDFLNANDEWRKVGLDYSTDLYNEGHVNIFGAEKYTDFLAEYIYEHYNLPDRRNDPAYAEWDRLYEEFEAKTTETKETIQKLDAENQMKGA